MDWWSVGGIIFIISHSTLWQSINVQHIKICLLLLFFGVEIFSLSYKIWTLTSCAYPVAIWEKSRLLIKWAICDRLTKILSLCALRRSQPTYFLGGRCENCYDHVIKRKHLLCYWPFVCGIHQSLVNSPHKGQWHRIVWCFLWSTRE